MALPARNLWASAGQQLTARPLLASLAFGTDMLQRSEAHLRAELRGRPCRRAGSPGKARGKQKRGPRQTACRVGQEPSRPSAASVLSNLHPEISKKDGLKQGLGESRGRPGSCCLEAWQPLAGGGRERWRAAASWQLLGLAASLNCTGGPNAAMSPSFSHMMQGQLLCQACRRSAALRPHHQCGSPRVPNLKGHTQGGPQAEQRFAAAGAGLAGRHGRRQETLTVH